MSDPGSKEIPKVTPDLAAEANLSLELANAKRLHAKAGADTELNLASEGDTLEEDDLEITDDTLPLFGTHADRDWG